jgi:hypothetical protein
MKKNIYIKNYQKNNELYIDNTISNLSDFQIEILLNIAKNDFFYFFETFDFLNQRKQNKITVSWYIKTSNNIQFKKTLTIGVKKLLTNIKTLKI